MKIRSEQHGLETDIYLYQEGMELPESGNYFVITGDGFYIHVDSGVMSGLVPCRKEDLTPFLGKLEEKAYYNFPAIPFEKFVQALVFLRQTYQKHRSEGCVILLYKIPTLNFRLKKASERLREIQAELPDNQAEWNLEARQSIIDQVNLIKEIQDQFCQRESELTDGGSGGLTGIDHSECEYVVVCPKQKVSGAGVHYGEEHTQERISDIVKEIRESDPEIEECGDDYSHQYMHVCSIHSHPDFEAYHSGVDDSDEFIWDGLHLTIGGVMKDDFQISASLTLQGTRFMLDPLDCVEGVAKSESGNAKSGMFSWVAPKQKDLYHLLLDPEDVLNMRVIRNQASKWLDEKVSKGFGLVGFRSNWKGSGNTTYINSSHVRHSDPDLQGFYGEPFQQDDQDIPPEDEETG